MKKDIFVVIFTKEPVTKDRIKSIQRVEKIERLSVVGVYIEDAMHLSFSKFFSRTIRRILQGNIYLPDFIINIVKLIFLRQPQNGDKPIEKLLRTPVVRVKNIESEEVRYSLKKLHADLGIIIGHRIIPESVFSLPRMGSINIHHGVLPRYAGSHSTFWRMTEGHSDVGVTIHKVSRKVDKGDILLIKKFKIKGLSNKEINSKILDIIPSAVESALKGLIDRKLKYKKQLNEERKYWKPPTFLERIKYRDLL